MEVLHCIRDSVLHIVGHPFYFMIRKDETMGQVKQRLKDKLAITDEEFASLKFGILYCNRLQYLRDCKCICYLVNKLADIIARFAFQNIAIQQQSTKPTTVSVPQKPVDKGLYIHEYKNTS